tara:strand:- start:6915 stop:7046 length:132 start_codon:yes stop_codon:yes gene_type:complete
MAKPILNVVIKTTKKRKGVHSKTKTSKSKNNINYKKTYKGQGR